jgi:hypothetical protein
MTPALLDDVLAFADHVGLKTRARVRDTSLSEMPREATEGASSGKSTVNPSFRARFALRAYQPSAQRVYQPSALPQGRS